MKYTGTVPCDNCPFVKEGGIRLHRDRARQIAGMMLSPGGGDFPCHKTTDCDDDGDRIDTFETVHCAGALIFALKNGNMTQLMRISERLGMWSARNLMSNKEAVSRVFDNLREMLKVQGRS